MNTRWTLVLQSRLPSPTWEAYATRDSALLTAIAGALPAEATWWDAETGPDTPLEFADIEQLTGILIDRQMRNDNGDIVSGGGSSHWVNGRVLYPDRTADLVLHGVWGGEEIPAHAALQVFEPGELLWSYPDEVISGLVAATLDPIQGSKARIRHRFLHRLLVKADAPFDVGSHVYMPVPLDDPSRFPPGARQVPCGKGWLLIVPPGASDEETLQRMRWVAAAIGATD